MIPIDCPVCGTRESSEFQYWGEVAEPSGNDDGDIKALRREHHLRVNDPGWMLERWMHVAGCGRFIQVERHRTSNAIRTTRLDRTSIAGDAADRRPAGDAETAPA